MNVRRLLVLLAVNLLTATGLLATRPEGGEGTLGGIIVYQALQNGVPFSFSHHGVMYETLGQNNVVDPTLFDVKLNGTTNLSYDRGLVVPQSIKEGVYTFRPISIARAAFQQTAVKSADFRAEIRTIPQSCFMFCSELESVRFHGDAPHFVEASAFHGCGKLKTISFPAQLKYIGAHAFDQCRSLTEIYIPKDVAYIGEYAFYACYQLSSVTFATGHFRLIPANCFQSCESLRNVVIPEGVSEIAEYAFNKSGLESITLPSTILNVRDNALTGTKLREIRCKAVSPPWVGANFTYGQCREITVHVPVGCETAYRQDSFWCNFPNIVADL